MEICPYDPTAVETPFLAKFSTKTLVKYYESLPARGEGRVGGIVNTSFPEQNSATVRNIFMILRITEQVNVECHMQE